jgi:hypothetical protein
LLASAYSTADAQMYVAWTINGVITFGRMWRSISRGNLVPDDTAACTKVCSRMVSTRLRTRRITRGTSGMVIATITVSTLAFVSDISAMASRMAGMDIRPSEIRMMMGSSHRMVPPSRPRVTPMTADSTATLAPMSMEMRPP